MFSGRFQFMRLAVTVTVTVTVTSYCCHSRHLQFFRYSDAQYYKCYHILRESERNLTMRLHSIWNRVMQYETHALRQSNPSIILSA